MTLIVLLIRNSDEEEEGDQVAWIMNYLFIADKDYGNMKNSIQNTYNLNVTTDQ